MKDYAENGRPAPLKIGIVVPILSDWDSLEKLKSSIVEVEALRNTNITLIVVDDGSPQKVIPSANWLASPVRSIHIVRLKANLSHQRAIALGLVYVNSAMDIDAVIVMDGDGEDRPADIVKLLDIHRTQRNHVIVAQRRRRTEGLRFKAGYAIFKFVFGLMTGKALQFGNFSLIPKDRIPNIVFNPNIWNSYSATVLRSRVPIKFVETDRGRRYFGRSRMNFPDLVVHGLSAISVYGDIVISRIIIGLVLLATIFVLSVGGVIGLMFFADYYNIPGFFIPGYATNIILSLANLMASAIFIGFVGILSLLASRSNPPAMPHLLLRELSYPVEIIEPADA